MIHDTTTTTTTTIIVHSTSAYYKECKKRRKQRVQTQTHLLAGNHNPSISFEKYENKSEIFILVCWVVSRSLTVTDPSVIDS